LLVSLGEVVVESRLRVWLSRLYDLLKDFALPAALGLLGFLFVRWQRIREAVQEKRDRDMQEERLRRERETELERLAEDQLRTWKVETLREMLPESHRLAKRHYAPTQNAVHWLLDSVNLCLQQSESDRRQSSEREAFYYLMLLGRQIQETVDRSGGFYFKDRVGEKLAGECWNAYLDLFFENKESVHRDYQRGRSLVGLHETLDEFLEKLDHKPGQSETAPKGRSESLQEAWKHFAQWYKTAEGNEGMSWLRAFEAVISYELNRPYKYWYESKEKLELGAGTEQLLLQAAARIQKAIDPNSLDFVKQAQEYLREGRNP
jgi:hypothetical protein